MELNTCEWNTAQPFTNAPNKHANIVTDARDMPNVGTPRVRAVGLTCAQ
jgi:hypothetical protein